MTIVVILLAVVAPAVTQIGGAASLTKSAYDITGRLEEARAYAKANSTYVWVGFYEEAADQSSGTAGVGRIIVSAVASKVGTALYTTNDSDPGALDYTNLVQIGKLLKIDNAHLTTLLDTDIPTRGKIPTSPGTVPDKYQVGKDDFAKRDTTTNRATFTFPLGVTGLYKFIKVIQFNPIGDATKVVDSPTQLMEIDLRPARGTVPDNNTKKLCRHPDRGHRWTGASLPAMNIPCRQQGFSLVEVTLALGIAVFCLVVVFGLMTVGFNTSAVSIEQTTATNLLAAIASDLRTAPNPFPKGREAYTKVYNLKIPASVNPPTTASVTILTPPLYLDPNGQMDNSATKSAAAYQLNVWTKPGVGRDATVVRIMLSWPPTAPIANAAGTVETVVALDRN